MRQKLVAVAAVAGLAVGVIVVPRFDRVDRWGLRPATVRLGAVTGAPQGSAAVRVRPTAAPVYRFTTITFPGSRDAQISGINSAGAYTGNVVGSSGNRPFIVSAPGVAPVFFRLPYAAAPSTVQTAGIDSAGGVAGTYADQRGVFHGFLRTAGGRYRQLDVTGAGTASGEGTEVAGISPGGVIVGNYLTSAKVAMGFIDAGDRISRVVERSAGTSPGEGTAVEFYSARHGYGGIFIDPGGAAHGWWIDGGKLRVVDDPAAGAPTDHKGTQLVGVDGLGRLYGIYSPARGATSAFWMWGGLSSAIRDPDQAGPGAGQTVVLGVNAGGVLVGSYTYDNHGRTRAFIAWPGV